MESSALAPSCNRCCIDILFQQHSGQQPGSITADITWMVSHPDERSFGDR